jgi:hypothetical protein
VRLTALLALAGATACASMGQPPGGPEDTTAPAVVDVSPDTGAVNVRGREIEIQFNEVVQEGSAGALRQFIMVSPSIGDPRVSWHRSRISIKPRRDLQPNTAYRVTVLPGISDLASNRMTEPLSFVFSTGPTIPTLGIAGRVFDWVGERPAGGAFVQAIARPTPTDSATIYQTVADTNGQFELGPLPAGQYDVRAVMDANKNRAIDPLEKWDLRSVQVTTVRPAVELLAIERDTTPPRIGSVTASDSVTIRVQLDDYLHPDQPLTTGTLRVLRADSTAVPISSIRSGAQIERERADSAARADSLRSAGRGAPPPPAARPPAGPGRGVVAEPPPKPASRPPANDLVIRLAVPLTPGRYVVVAAELRNLLGKVGESRMPFDYPPK